MIDARNHFPSFEQHLAADSAGPVVPNSCSHSLFLPLGPLRIRARMPVRASYMLLLFCVFVLCVPAFWSKLPRKCSLSYLIGADSRTRVAHRVPHAIVLGSGEWGSFRRYEVIVLDAIDGKSSILQSTLEHRMRDLNIDPGQVEFLGPGELSRLRVDAARVGVLFSGIQRFRSIPYTRPAAPHLC